MDAKQKKQIEWCLAQFDEFIKGNHKVVTIRSQWYLLHNRISHVIGNRPDIHPLPPYVRDIEVKPESDESKAERSALPNVSRPNVPDDDPDWNNPEFDCPPDEEEKPRPAEPKPPSSEMLHRTFDFKPNLQHESHPLPIGYMQTKNIADHGTPFPAEPYHRYVSDDIIKNAKPAPQSCPNCHGCGYIEPGATCKVCGGDGKDKAGASGGFTCTRCGFHFDKDAGAPYECPGCKAAGTLQRGSYTCECGHPLNQHDLNEPYCCGSGCSEPQHKFKPKSGPSNQSRVAEIDKLATTSLRRRVG